MEGVHKPIKMTDERSDVSEVANNTSDVPEQVPGKKRDAVCNRRDASVLEKLKTSSVEDIILDEMKTQILSISGMEYLSLSAKVRLHFCREMGIMVPNKKRKKEDITELILNHVSGGVERDRQAAHEEEIESTKDSSCSIDEGWNIILHHQCDMFYGRTTTVSEHQAGNVTCYFR